MSNALPPSPRSTDAWKDWLTQTATLTLPRWAFVAGGVAAFLLLLIALD